MDIILVLFCSMVFFASAYQASIRYSEADEAGAGWGVLAAIFIILGLGTCGSGRNAGVFAIIVMLGFFLVLMVTIFIEPLTPRTR